MGHHTLKQMISSRHPQGQEQLAEVSQYRNTYLPEQPFIETYIWVLRQW